MKLETPELTVELAEGILLVKTRNNIPIYVNGRLFEAHIPLVTRKPKSKWVTVKDGIIKNGDKVSRGDYCDFARGLIGVNVARAMATGWTIRRKIQTS